MLKNRNGFTLIELLATIVILGIIMVIAVPNVTGIIYRSRANTYIEDAKKMVTLTDYAMRGGNNKITKPGENQCIIFSLYYLDNAEFEDPPNGGDYQKNNSFVVVKRKDNKLVYYVQIVEKFKDNYRGVPFVESSELNKEGASGRLVDNFADSDIAMPVATAEPFECSSFVGTYTS